MSLQIEHKTEKGTLCFLKVPDDAIAFNFYMGYLTYKVYNPKAMCNDDILGNPYRLTKFLEKTENISEYIDGNPIKSDENFILIAVTNDITQECAKTLVDSPIIDFGHEYDCFKDYIKECWTIETDSALKSFKSLMQHLQVYEVNPLGSRPIAQGSEDWEQEDMEDATEEWEKLNEKCGKWIVLFKPND